MDNSKLQLNKQCPNIFKVVALQYACPDVAEYPTKTNLDNFKIKSAKVLARAVENRFLLPHEKLPNRFFALIYPELRTLFWIIRCYFWCTGMRPISRHTSVHSLRASFKHEENIYFAMIIARCDQANLKLI